MGTMKALDLNENEIAGYFIELDALRESGKINMFGAPKWLQETFGLTKDRATAIFIAWSKTYQGDA